MRSNLKILLVEDSETQALLTKKQLEAAGHDITHKYTLGEAVDYLNQKVPDIILLDLSLPDSDGIETVKNIKRNAPEIPIIVLSSNDNREIAIEAVKLGSQDFLVKENKNDSEIFLRCIHYALERNADKLSLLKKTKELEEANQTIRENQALIIQSRLMSSLGHLAAGVAHEINNPISFIMSNFSTLENYFCLFKKVLLITHNLINALISQDSDKLIKLISTLKEINEKEKLSYVENDIQDLLKETHHGLKRVQQIISHLKAFAHLDEDLIQYVDCREALETTLEVLKSRIQNKCKVIKNFNAIPLFRCYSGLMNQVWMNILLNAVEAVHEKAVINVETEETERDIIVKISDNGEGIAEENLSKIFDPFYTTKPVGKNTGLGLFVVYTIITKHNGKIKAESQYGKGTTFTITLPKQATKDFINKIKK